MKITVNSQLKFYWPTRFGRLRQLQVTQKNMQTTWKVKRNVIRLFVMPMACFVTSTFIHKKKQSNSLLHLLGTLFPHINDDARSKSHQICYSWGSERPWSGWGITISTVYFTFMLPCIV